MHLEPSSEGDRDAEAKLRERSPTAVNTYELLGLMKVTRAVHQQRIAKNEPTITDILRRYPRLPDMHKHYVFFRYNYVKSQSQQFVMVTCEQLYCNALNALKTLIMQPTQV